MRCVWGWAALAVILAASGCAPASPLLADGNIKTPEGYEIIRAPGQSDQAFAAQYQECLRSEGPSGFPNVCMTDQGSSLLLSNGHIMSSTMTSAQKSRAENCRRFSNNFTDSARAFNVCTTYLGKNITLADGRTIPAILAFGAVGSLREDTPRLAAPTPVPMPAPHAGQTNGSAANAVGAGDNGPSQIMTLVKWWLTAQGLAAAKTGQSAASASTPTSAPSGPFDDDNPFAPSLGKNYLQCGNMYGC